VAEDLLDNLDTRCEAHELVFLMSSRGRHTRWPRDWSSDVCSSDLRSIFTPSLARAAPATFDCRSPFSVSGRSESGAPSAASAWQIGRASCRERVRIRVPGVAFQHGTRGPVPGRPATYSTVIASRAD